MRSAAAGADRRPIPPFPAHPGPCPEKGWAEGAGQWEKWDQAWQAPLQARRCRRLPRWPPWALWKPRHAVVGTRSVARRGRAHARGAGVGRRAPRRRQIRPPRGWGGGAPRAEGGGSAGRVFAEAWSPRRTRGGGPAPSGAESSPHRRLPPPPPPGACGSRSRR
eukprot:scaffold2729_cov403-Prasinococcus_capsulatus_cf.AAC.9